MTIDTLVPLITNLGFPIVVCGYLLWHNTKREEAADIKDANTNNILTELTQAVNNNTAVIQRLMGK